jgi:hypothetical protein
MPVRGIPFVSIVLGKQTHETLHRFKELEQGLNNVVCSVADADQPKTLCLSCLNLRLYPRYRLQNTHGQRHWEKVVSGKSQCAAL